MPYLKGDYFQSLTAGLKQSSGRARVLAGTNTSEHNAGAGQTGPVEHLRTRGKNYNKSVKLHGSKLVLKHITIHDAWHVYRAKLVLFQGVEGELQFRALVFIQVFPALPHLLQRRQSLRLQQHSSWDGHLTVGGREVGCIRYF